jgi:glycosyltransferase involved in cell wall biosynthesis
MRIALITPGFSADESDWCIPVLLDLVRRLARDHDVHVFALRYPHRRGDYRVYGATVHALGGAGAVGMARLPLLARALALVARYGRDAPFDVVHGFWADEPGFLAVAAGRLFQRPALVSLMGGELVRMTDIRYGGQLSRANRWLTRIALSRAACVTTGSTFLQRMAQPWALAERLTLLPLGVDPLRFSPAAPPEDSPLVKGTVKLLHVASLVPVKDQALLLRALARIVPQVPGAHLHIAGDGPLHDSLAHLAASLGLADNVTFHGAVAHERLLAFYRTADLCLLTSRYESQGLVTLEAAACGRVTAGTAVGFLPDLVPELAVPVGDDRALAAVVTGLLGDSPRHSALREAARAQVEAQYTLFHSVATLTTLYRRLAC